MATHDELGSEFDGIDGANGFHEAGDREYGIHGNGFHEQGEEQGIGNGSLNSIDENSVDAAGRERTREQNEASEQRRRYAEREHDDELSRSRGMQEYWKRLSERVADVGQRINRRIHTALDNSLGADGMEPGSSPMMNNGNDRMRRQGNDPKPYRRIE